MSKLFFPHFTELRPQEVLEPSWRISRPQQISQVHPSSEQLHASSPASAAAFTTLREDKLVTQAGKLGLTHAEKLSSIEGIWYFNLFLQTSLSLPEAYCHSPPGSFNSNPLYTSLEMYNYKSSKPLV